MRFQELEAEWDDDNVEHIARRRVEPEEVEEIIYEDCYPSWIVRGRRRVAMKRDGGFTDKRAPVVISSWWRRRTRKVEYGVR